jgi:hypothetical protein
VLQHCVSRSYSIAHVFEEVGSGMTDTRVKMLRLFDLAVKGEIGRVVIEHKDRLARFNFNIGSSSPMGLRSSGSKTYYQSPTKRSLSRTWSASCRASPQRSTDAGQRRTAKRRRQKRYAAYLKVCISTMLVSHRFTVPLHEKQSFFPPCDLLSSQIVKNVRDHAIGIVSGWAASKYTTTLDTPSI